MSVYVLCFRQKTVDVLRISDGSSDVCSSDLIPDPRSARHNGIGIFPRHSAQTQVWWNDRSVPERSWPRLAGTDQLLEWLGQRAVADAASDTELRRDVEPDGEIRRSEEHTSELQSLMRISYAVFCLKKKKEQ